MDIKNKLQQLAEHNENFISIKEKYDNNKFDPLFGRYNAPYEIGLNDTLDLMENFSEELIKNEDLKQIDSVSSFFQLLRKKSSEYLEKRDKDTEELQKINILKKLLINDIKENILPNNNFNIIDLNNFPNNKPHKVIEAFQELSKEFPNKFKIESVQTTSLNLSNKNISILFHGNLNELLEEIKKSKNNKVNYIKSINKNNAEQYFKSPLEENMILISNQLIQLNNFDIEDFNSLYKNELTKKSTNKIKR